MHKIKMQRFKRSGHFHSHWFMVSRTQGFLSYYLFPKSLFRTYYFKYAPYFDELWCGRIEVNLEKGRETAGYLKTELLIAGDDSLGAFSGFCFNASTVSSFALAFVDLSIKLNNWLDWYETWISVGKLLKFQTAHFLVFTETERTFIANITHLSFIKLSIG